MTGCTCGHPGLTYDGPHEDCPLHGKPRYRLVSASADGWYYFVNLRSSGIEREHYAIRRSDFWHQHIDGSGEGYCSCGAERCSLPGCDMGCVHPGGWIGPYELAEMRRPSAVEYLRRVVMDYAPDDCPEGCACSAATARRYLAEGKA